MPDDIRIHLSFRYHRKRKRLQYKLGPAGVICLLNLWLMSAEQFPSGHLKNYSVEDIEIDAGWEGESGKFVEALLDKKITFLEKHDDGFYLHNWKTRQSWVYNSENRSNISRFNMLSKKNKRIYEELQKLNINSVSREEYALLTNSEATLKQRLENFKHCLSESLNSISPVPVPSPVPSPSPVPLHKITPEPSKKQTTEFKPIKNKTPAKNAGTFNPKNMDVKNSDYSKNLSDTFLQINALCNEIFKLPKNSDKKKTFDARKWAQKKLSLKKHPGAIEKSLDGLKIYWDRSRDPWAYAENILSKVNGTFNEADAVFANKEFKKLSGTPELLKLTAGLLKEI